MLNTVVLTLGRSAPEAVQLRCRAHAELLARLRTIDGTPAVLADGPRDAAAALAELGRIATLVGPPHSADLRYVPSRAARERVIAEWDGQWPQAVTGRQRKAFRRAFGAVFRFPLESESSRESESRSSSLTEVEVFITDWSPCPAAAAVALHPAHPLSTGLGTDQEAEFTGRFCRHPLTGDLLPIWTAAWVKPDFGTGAVLVNPGHDAADLAFARRVGLPIRFALAPSDHTDTPQSWQIPPVVKTGVAVRTGTTDGLPFDQAHDTYLATLTAHKLAETYVDRGVGSFPAAVVAEDGSPVCWDLRRGTVAQTDTDGTAVMISVRALPQLAVLDPEIAEAVGTVVAPSSSADTDLLALRLMLAEGARAHSTVPEVVLVGGAAGKVEGHTPEALTLTLTMGAGISETLSVKPQMMDESEHFLSSHATLVDTDTVEDRAADDGRMKTATQIKGLLLLGDTKPAFRQLYRLQKTLVKSTAISDVELTCYQALAHVIAGVPTRHDHAALTAAWRLI